MSYRPLKPDYQHQTAAKSKARGKSAFAYFMEQGTGKTKCMLDEIGELAYENEIDLALVIAPNGVHRNWLHEVEAHVNQEQVPCGVHVYRSGNTDKTIKETKALLNAKGKFPIITMNVEALSSESGVTYARRLLASRKRAIIAVDEAHKIKTPNSSRTKAAMTLASRSAIRRILTGTPGHEGLEDYYAQFRFLDPEIIGHRTYTGFKSEFCIMGGFEGRAIVDYQNKDVLRERIDPYVFEALRKDCLDLPPLVETTREVELSREQIAAYRQLKRDLILEIDSGIIDASMAAKRLVKLQQILSGFLITDDGQLVEFPCPRLDMATEIMHAGRGKAIIFCRFQQDVQRLEPHLKAHGIDCAPFYGAMNEQQRAESLARFRRDPNCRAFLATAATGGTGLTINEASVTIFYSHGWSLTEREQAIARNYRIGQGESVVQYSLFAPGTIDEKILRSLRGKRDLVDEFRSVSNIKAALRDGA